MDVLDQKALEYAGRALQERQWEPISPLGVGISTVSSALIPAALRLALGVPMTPMSVLPKTLLFGALGYLAPTIVNQFIKRHNEDPEAASRYLAERFALTEQQFGKQASFAKFLTGVGGKTFSGGKFIGKGLGELGKGVFMPLNPKGAQNKALSWVSKGLMGYGAYKGGKYVAKKLRRPDYVTYLRNQMLAGRISPAELSPGDLESVRSLGV
jgi:hypothetical protein